MRLAGRVDRIDRLMQAGSEKYLIWDYKTGSDSSYSVDDPVKQGRKLQSFLYLHMLRHCIVAQGGQPEQVTAFGYFFPTARSEGRRIEYSEAVLRRGEPVIMQLMSLLESGAFATTTHKDDCTFCCYTTICSPEVIVERISNKMQDPYNEVLSPWRALRDKKASP